MTRRFLPLNRRQMLTLAAGAMALPTALRANSYTGAPSLEGMGLPPVSERLPLNPRVVPFQDLGLSLGQHGGRLRILIGGQRDIRFVPISSYARLIGYDRTLTLSADILEHYEVDAERAFTFYLRKGHRWSDGSAFTGEDFRFAWQDYALNKELYPSGPPVQMRVEGALPEFTVLDDTTVRYVWPSPNPDFLEQIASPVPPRLALPAAYLKQFHPAYQTPEKIAAFVAKQRVGDWVDLMQRMSRQNRPENPDLPTLEAWMPRTLPPSEQFIFTRNPYFHRVDEAGLQLPYIDELDLNISSADIIPAKTGSGDSDLQFTGVDFSDYTYLKEAEKRFPIKVSLWRQTRGSRMVLAPNLTCKDPVWRGLLRDVRVRRAMSLAVNRHEINMAVFFGLAKEGNDTVLPESPLFTPELATLWAVHDPDQANALLDEVGLVRPAGRRIRRLPDGRRAQIVVETPGESAIQTDILQLIADHWREVGLELLIRTSQRDIFRARVMSGDIVMSVWEGLDNGVPTADMSPAALAPTSDDQSQWPLWGAYFLSRGKVGEPPALPQAQRLLDLNQAWNRSVTPDERAQIWAEMLRIRAEEVFTIGTVNQSLQPIVKAKALQNLPDAGLYGFAPTAYLGVYMPDTFWLASKAVPAAPASASSKRLPT